MRTLVLAAIFAFSALAAKASTYEIDLTQPGGIVGTGGTSWFQPGCYCSPKVLFYSPVYQFDPGDMIDFGTVTIGSYQSGASPDAGPNQLPLFIQGGISVLFNPPLTGVPWVNPDYFLGTDPGPYTTPLIYEIPAESSTIQLAWFDAVVYIPPQIAAVPEPSTWAMLLIGFAGIGLVSYRRQRPIQG